MANRGFSIRFATPDDGAKLVDLALMAQLGDEQERFAGARLLGPMRRVNRVLLEVRRVSNPEGVETLCNVGATHASPRTPPTRAPAPTHASPLHVQRSAERGERRLAHRFG